MTFSFLVFKVLKGYEYLGLEALLLTVAVIDDCVKGEYPKKYEWAAAFGLVFTVLWLYLKILDLLMELSSKKDN